MRITELEHNKTYEYSGINGVNGINNAIKKKVRILLKNKSQIKNRIECKE